MGCTHPSLPLGSRVLQGGQVAGVQEPVVEDAELV